VVTIATAGKVADTGPCDERVEVGKRDISAGTVTSRVCSPTPAPNDILDTQTWRIDVWKH
jgi:hypothetical protein